MKKARALLSKLPMRQLTADALAVSNITFSKLPMRQLTKAERIMGNYVISKLPMRQLTIHNLQA